MLAPPSHLSWPMSGSEVNTSHPWTGESRDWAKRAESPLSIISRKLMNQNTTLSQQIHFSDTFFSCLLANREPTQRGKTIEFRKTAHLHKLSGCVVKYRLFVLLSPLSLTVRNQPFREHHDWELAWLLCRYMRERARSRKIPVTRVFPKVRWSKWRLVTCTLPRSFGQKKTLRKAGGATFPAEGI